MFFFISELIMKDSLSLGDSFITLSSGGNEARAMAANVSIIKLTQSIWVTVRGDSVPIKEPTRTIKHAATLTVSWNKMKRWIFWNKERPHITARAILLKELSIIVISLASFATDVPSPIDKPTCAALSAGASLVPSPVTATTSFSDWRFSTKYRLSIGRAREITFTSDNLLFNSAPDRVVSSAPVIWLVSGSFSSHNPIWRAISLAVPEVSPVTILTLIPALTHSLTAWGTSIRIGSEIATIPRNVRLLQAILPSTIGDSSDSRIR